MPKPTSPKHQSKDSLQSVTKKEMKKLFAGQREEMEQLLADQANVILEAVDELVEKKMDKKLDEKFNPVIMIKATRPPRLGAQIYLSILRQRRTRTDDLSGPVKTDQRSGLNWPTDVAGD